MRRRPGGRAERGCAWRRRDIFRFFLFGFWYSHPASRPPVGSPYWIDDRCLLPGDSFSQHGFAFQAPASLATLDSSPARSPIRVLPGRSRPRGEKGKVRGGSISFWGYGSQLAALPRSRAARTPVPTLCRPAPPGLLLQEENVFELGEKTGTPPHQPPRQDRTKPGAGQCAASPGGFTKVSRSSPAARARPDHKPRRCAESRTKPRC